MQLRNLSHTKMMRLLNHMGACVEGKIWAEELEADAKTTWAKACHENRHWFLQAICDARWDENVLNLLGITYGECWVLQDRIDASEKKHNDAVQALYTQDSDHYRDLEQCRREWRNWIDRTKRLITFREEESHDLRAPELE